MKVVQDGEVIKTEYWCPNDRYRLCSEKSTFIVTSRVIKTYYYYYYYYLLLHRTASLVIIQCN